MLLEGWQTERLFSLQPPGAARLRAIRKAEDPGGVRYRGLSHLDDAWPSGGLGRITVEPEGLFCGCGNHGCLQTVANDAAFLASLAQRLGRTLTMDEVVRLSQSDEIDVRPELDRTLDYLAIGVAAVIYLLNPAAIFINGALFDADDGAFQRLVEAVRRRGLRPLVAQCSLFRAQANDTLGALSYAIEDVLASVGPRLA